MKCERICCSDEAFDDWDCEPRRLTLDIVARTEWEQKMTMLCAAQPFFLKEWNEKQPSIDLPTFTRLHRGLLSSIAVSVQWVNDTSRSLGVVQRHLPDCTSTRSWWVSRHRVARIAQLLQHDKT